ncbi:methyltransferase family protein [Pseudomonas panipatensis]|uniref:Phospholipid methyltransferase n=1 Tax=Pseudomonas panipatensis TaxID=428992 RepID=A0A1G8M9G9_9PSED|nr:isoprenylcysteine carboxylmethyltransferase family protein [Pseudomonas panipatensis]SDI64572.1 Phospholipid methyltransferase [Pseudomonas panipatensis]SMP76566.1 Phospholipid methyltransferase [Pseudomonas panipatensis]
MKALASWFESKMQCLWSYKVARVGSRIIVFAVFLQFAVLLMQTYLEVRTINYLLLFLGEVLTISLIVFARDTESVRLAPVAFLCAMAATFYYLYFSFDVGLSLFSDRRVAEFVQIFGIAFQIFAKLSLGRSFGLVPANRGVVTTGAYRLVRHPIYLGYLLGHVGFILGAFSIRNAVLLVVLYFFQGIRILEEEKFLRREPEYLKYVKRVRWRAIPGLF